GCLLALFGGLFLVLIESLWLGRFRDRVWAYACASPILVVVAYLIESVAIHWMSFGTFPLGSYASTLATSGIALTLGCLVVLAVYRWLSGSENRVRPAVMAWALVGVMGAGTIASSILTGLPRDVTGVYEDLAGMGSGLPVFQVPLTSGLALNPIYAVRSLLAGWGLIRFAPPPRALLNGTPAWELLHHAGVDSAVVRFRFTYPPEGQARVLVSDWIGDDHWTEMGVQRTAADAVTPRDRAAELIAPFLHGAASDVALLADMLPAPTPPQPADMKKDPIAELRLSLDIDGRTFEASEAIIRNNRAQPFLAVYIAGLDSVEHAFWQYSFPEDFPSDPPARQDVDRLRHVLDRYIEYVDRRLSRLLARYETMPNVLIVSDHGMGPSTISSDFRGWHAKDGVFLLAGPAVPHDGSSRQVSYYDVLPTILRLKGFEKPEALRGKSVLPAAEGCKAAASSPYNCGSK
ncbi:MAG: alkaline phosphatase family protein, partial [Vicinamibacterales bacterium]